MHIYVNGRNLEITDAIKAYVKEKMGKIEHHYEQVQGIDVVLSVIKNPSVAKKHVAEVTCKLNSGKIHCEETAESMYESIDLLADKLDRQVIKFKDKALTSKGKTNSIRTDKVDAEEQQEALEEFEALEDEAE